MEPFLSAAELEALRHLETCAVEDAIETFDLRARNTGFASSEVQCIFDALPPVVGYAATARMRSGERPMAGRSYHDRTDWWKSILSVPEPRIVVMQDLDEPPGVGAFLGDVHAAMLKALGGVAFVTNGAVREVAAIRKLGLQVFAHNRALSHVYARIIDFGSPVMVGGLEVRPGDLLHGDGHGLLSVPRQIASAIPRVAAEQAERDRRVLAVCESADFSVEKLRDALKRLP
ncbi:MAG TPA: RraA family protein [Terriglobia bacterium]|jgi:4-hydroxy-4-methyl-2-oxoglutarate aldolase|nr:RraA family protein [Terriglobia bacterium]